MVDEAVPERLQPRDSEECGLFTIAVVLNMYVDDGTTINVLDY